MLTIVRNYYHLITVIQKCITLEKRKQQCNGYVTRTIENQY